MTSDIVEKLKRLGGAKVTTAATLGMGVAKSAVIPQASKPTAKVAANWAEELYGSSDTAEEDVVDEEVEDEDEIVEDTDEDEVDEDADEDSDIPEDSHREPVQFKPSPIKAESLTGVPAPGSFDADAFARKVADLVIAKMRDALNHLPS